MKVRTRRLWLSVRFSVPDKSISRQRIIDTLISSVRRGDYEIPSSWRVAILWRNRPDVKPNIGEWTEELNNSAHGPSGSSGFDKAVLAYLEQAR